jgi:hypothetical protein
MKGNTEPQPILHLPLVAVLGCLRFYGEWTISSSTLVQVSWIQAVTVT